MNNGTLALANHYCEEYLNRSCHWLQLMKDDLPTRHALMETSSASSLVTDSAAAGSAWSCGQRILNGRLNIANDGSKLTPLYTHAKKAGKWLGLATTTRITHATPASFAISEIDRNAEDTIAEKFLDSGVDIFLGGGSRHFAGSRRKDDKDLFLRFQEQGYKIVQTRDELLQPLILGHGRPQNSPRMLGTFWDSHLPYTIELQNSEDITATVPTLVEMMQAALDRLILSSDGFLLQIEGGRVDHAGHANDAGAILHDQLAFDDCIPVAKRFAEENPDTLVIVTTDHGTGGCMLNGMGKSYNDTTKRFDNLRRIRASFEHIAHLVSQSSDAKEATRIVGDHLGIKMEAAAADKMITFIRDENLYGAADFISPLVYERTGVSFTSHQHTGDLVEFIAFGAGAEHFPAYLENWQLNDLLRKAMDI